MDRVNLVPKPLPLWKRAGTQCLCMCHSLQLSCKYGPLFCTLASGKTGKRAYAQYRDIAVCLLCKHTGDGNQFMSMVDLPKGAVVELELRIRQRPTNMQSKVLIHREKARCRIIQIDILLLCSTLIYWCLMDGDNVSVTSLYSGTSEEWIHMGQDSYPL